ncbi:MAG: hypothetical protein EKK64_04900 [Neisseriaceae bacterium]|nr:MAG: hypothetical protein EKK64_04900 [Neisseriaceae bacterium]
MSIPTQIVVNGEQMTIDAAPRFTLLVHQQGIRVNVPDFVEINSRNTIECMEKMNQKQWEHISTGQLFQVLFNECFRDNLTPIPKTIQELNAGDFGIIHVSGIIVLACEAIFSGKTKIFFRTPEDHLHPKTERTIMGMFNKMIDLLGQGDGGVATLVEDGKKD